MKRENKYAIFEFEKCDEDLIEPLSNYIEEKAQKAFEFFEVTPSTKVPIKIIPTKKEYDEYYIKTHNMPSGSKVHGWVIGNFNHNQINYLSLHDFKNTTHALKDVPFEEALDYYKKTIFHEFVHYANGLFRIKHKCGYTQKYLVEGIATYLSEQHDAKKLKFNFSVDDVLDNDKHLYYAYFLLTKYFVENYDKSFVLENFKDADKAKEFLKTELYDKAKEHYTECEKKK